MDITARAAERIIATVGHPWNSFFSGASFVSDDSLPERANQHQPKQEVL